MIKYQVLGVLFILALAPGLCLAADWPQLQNGPQRQGYSSENIDIPIARAWATGFSPERLHPQTQPVIAGGKVYIGTAMGTFYAFNAVNGSVEWTYPGCGEIINTAGVENGKVFFADMDGCVYALDASTGALAWKFDCQLPWGFSTAVLLAEGKVFVANRKGIYYALDQATGIVAWERDIGVPILMSSAYNNGKVFVGAMDMRCYALDSTTGNILWTSDPLWGSTFKDYWPLCYQGKVILRPRRAERRASITSLPFYHGPFPQSELDRQDTYITHHNDNPHEKDMFVLDENTGAESIVVVQFSRPVMAGAVGPPCVDGDGKLIVHAKVDGWRGGWGRLDLSTGKIVEVLYDGSTLEGTGNEDETLLMSAAGRSVFIMHVQEANAQFTGTWHLDRRDWTRIGSYNADGGYFYSNTQGGGTCPASISNGMIYHTTENTLNARTATIP